MVFMWYFLLIIYVFVFIVRIGVEIGVEGTVDFLVRGWIDRTVG